MSVRDPERPFVRKGCDPYEQENRKLNPTVRMGLLIAAGLILGLLLTNKTGLLSLFNSLS